MMKKKCFIIPSSSYKYFLLDAYLYNETAYLSDFKNSQEAWSMICKAYFNIFISISYGNSIEYSADKVTGDSFKK